MSSVPKFFTSSVFDDETGVQLQVITIPKSVVKQYVGELDLGALLQTRVLATTLVPAAVRGTKVQLKAAPDVGSEAAEVGVEAAVAKVAQVSDIVPISDLHTSVAILVDSELPRSVVTELQSRSDYFAQREQLSSSIANRLLHESIAVLEQSPLRVEDFSQVLSQTSAVGAAYSIDLKDGPVVVFEHFANIVITAAALGIATGLRKGISELIIRLLNLPQIGRKR